MLKPFEISFLKIWVAKMKSWGVAPKSEIAGLDFYRLNIFVRVKSSQLHLKVAYSEVDINLFHKLALTN